MAMALGRALDCLGCLGGGHGSSRSYRYSYYAPNPIGNSTYRYDFGRVRGRKGRGRSLSYRMCCEGLRKVVKHALHKLRGVDSVEVNLPLEKVTVTGYVDRNKVLKGSPAQRKKGGILAQPGPALYFTTTTNYFQDEEAFRESYNYWRHGYNGDRHGNLPASRRERTASATCSTTTM
ncbi:hypothetical protein HPP92_021974 [Vanilla planifolia]|uniref:HMA domain-containing protein n=1 Tax=Vanilla planifolia TaxID=51239 RepID=A0A835UGT4_VANPL|nr:hypothetical protein HPP92_021974 [Vanilla planifolia]